MRGLISELPINFLPQTVVLDPRESISNLPENSVIPLPLTFLNK